MQCSSVSSELPGSVTAEADTLESHEPIQAVKKQTCEPKDAELASGDKASSEALYNKKKAQTEQLTAPVHSECEPQDIQRDCDTKQATSESKTKQRQALKGHLPKDTDESLRGKTAECESLRKAVRDLENKQGSLKKQLGSMADELAHYKSLTEKHKQDHKNLKIDKQAVQLQLSKAQYLIKCQNEIITRQGREVCFHHELLEDLQERTTGMQRTIRDLQNQADQMRKEEILAGFHNLEEEFIFLAKSTEPPHSPKELGEDGLQSNVQRGGFWGRFAHLPVDMVTGLCTVGVFAILLVLKSKLNA